MPDPSSPGNSTAPPVRENKPSAGGGHFQYRPEIDGLRALAVIAVVLFHAGLSFKGGYIGVDVFFVISGYLITSLILKDLGKDKFSMVDFWERRVRRIVPAQFVMVCVTLVAGLLMMPHDFKALGESAIFQTIAASNIYFYKTSGYFFGSPEIKPLLHTWSLAVEEQFYLFLPLLLLLVHRLPLVRKKAATLVVLLGIFTVSFALAAWLAPLKASATFFLLPTRAWELLAGSLLAMVPAAMVPGNRLFRELCTLAGLACMIVPIFTYTEHTVFPGLAAVPPVLGAVLFILGNTPRPDGAPGLSSAGRFFASRPVVFVGLISYSLYLWHWPVLVFGKYWFAGQREPLGITIAMLAVMMLAAVISWRFVETPFRVRRAASTRRGVFTFGLASASIMILGGIVVALGDGHPRRFSAPVVENWKAAESKPTIEAGARFGKVDDGSAAQVLLWGDSHAACVAGALDTICAEEGVTGIYLHRNDLGPADIAPFAKSNGISRVVISQYWILRDIQEGNEQYLALVDMIHALDEAGCKVWFLLDFPNTDADVPRALSRTELFGWQDDSWKRTVEGHRLKNEGMYKLAASGAPATFLDLSEPLVDASGKSFVTDDGGVSLYYDDDHLTKHAILKYLLPQLRTALAGKLHGPTS